MTHPTDDFSWKTQPCDHARNIDTWLDPPTRRPSDQRSDEYRYRAPHDTVNGSGGGPVGYKQLSALTARRPKMNKMIDGIISTQNETISNLIRITEK